MQINNNFQKNANISKVARLLWKTPEISRVEIARQLDLYRSTVTNVVNSLIDHGVVFEGAEGAAMPQGGRKPICLALNKKFGCVVGLELQPSGYHAVIINVFGSVLFSCNGKLPACPFDGIFDYILDKLKPEIKKLEIPLLGICAGMPGIINSGTGEVIRSDPFQLGKIALSRIFSEKYKVPVIIENDANCLAWKELAHNREENLDNFICLNAEFQKKDLFSGTGEGMSVGIGVAVGGSVYSGSKHAAGEFVSISWKGNEKEQTGISEKDMASLNTDPTSFSKWIVDLFESLVPVVSVLDPSAVFVHGELARNSEKVRKIIAEKVPQFDILMKKIGCTLVYGDGSNYSVATGAALMYFLYLFSIPGGNTGQIGSSIDWDTVFELSAGV